MMSRPKAAFFLTIFAVQLFFSNHYLDGDMANSILDLSAAIVDEGRLEIDTYHRDSIDLAEYGGHYYSGKAPGLSFAAIPLYAGARGLLALLPGDLEARLDDRARASVNDRYLDRPTVRNTPHPVRLMLAHVFLNVLISASTLLIAWLLYRALLRWPNVPPSRAVLAAPALAFGTIYFYWGNYVCTQVVAAALILLAFYLVEFAARPASAGRRAILAGLALGAACATDYAAAIAAVSLGLFWAAQRRWRILGLLALGGAAPVAAMALYHYVAFGSPLTTPYSHLAFTPLQDTPTLGLALPTGARLLRLGFGAAEGLFTTMPTLIPALAGLLALARERASRRYAALGLGLGAAYGLYVAFVPYDNSLGGFGARFFLPAIPFLLFGLAAPFGPARSPGWWAAGLLCAASVAVNLLSAFYGTLLFEESLGELVQRYGLSSYTLRTLNEYGVLAGPWVSTVVVAVVLAAAGYILWRQGRRLAGLGQME